LPDNQWAFTPAYASCERCETGIASFADDVYATAVVAYELLSGQHPFHRTPSLKAHNQGMKAKRIDVLSDRQWQTLQQALAFDPERRLPSIAAFREGILP
jgi:serine/threonine protein kinase